jgi:hypothetical protein
MHRHKYISSGSGLKPGLVQISEWRCIHVLISINIGHKKSCWPGSGWHLYAAWFLQAKPFGDVRLFAAAFKGTLEKQAYRAVFKSGSELPHSEGALRAQKVCDIKRDAGAPRKCRTLGRTPYIHAPQRGDYGHISAWKVRGYDTYLNDSDIGIWSC